MMRALLLCLLALPLQAETLADAWNLALERNNALAAVRSQVDAARADADAARAERWPKLSVDGSYQRFGDAPAFSFPVGGQDFLSPPLVEDDDFYAARAHIELPLFTAGRITAGIESAELGARAAGSASDSAAQDLKLAVASAYVDVLRAGRSLTAAESQVESLRSLVNDVTVMVEQEAVARTTCLPLNSPWPKPSRSACVLPTGCPSRAPNTIVCSASRWTGSRSLLNCMAHHPTRPQQATASTRCSLRLSPGAATSPALMPGPGRWMSAPAVRGLPAGRRSA